VGHLKKNKTHKKSDIKIFGFHPNLATYLSFLINTPIGKLQTFYCAGPKFTVVGVEKHTKFFDGIPLKAISTGHVTLRNPGVFLVYFKQKLLSKGRCAQ